MWQSRGLSGSNDRCLELLGKHHGWPAIVAGNARGVFEEVSKAQSKLARCIVFAVNDVSVFLSRVDHMVSLHTPKLAMWAYLRRDPTSKGYGNKDFQVHDAGLYGEQEWHQWTGLTPQMALSGLFAAQIAWLMGCEPIVLCGCPTDTTPCFWETTGTTSNPGYTKHGQGMLLSECARLPEFGQALRSMGGWSQAVLGCL